MTWLTLGAVLVAVAFGRFILLRRGLIDSREHRRMLPLDRKIAAWKLDAPKTEGKVCGATDADGSHRIREQRANPGMKTPGRSATEPRAKLPMAKMGLSGHPIPEVQREIDRRETFRAAMAFAEQRPCEVVTIHEHQADAQGREKRN